MVWTLISPLRKSKLNPPKRALHSSRGFTLVEVLIVLGIFVGLAGYAIPKLMTRRGDNIKKVARQMTTLTKELRNRAKLKNAVVRLVIDMRDEKEHKYWVEYSNETKPVPANLYEPQEEEDEENKNPSPFQRDELLSKKNKTLPSSLFFGLVETVNTKGPITQGVAYIHFFPEGFVEASVIQITNKKDLTWTLVISPLTGQAEIITEAKSLKEL